MFDLSFTELTSTLYLYCSLLFFLILGLYWNRCVINPYIGIKSKNSAVLLSLLIIFFAVTYCVDLDYFGYKELVESYHPGMERFHLEHIYTYIILAVGSNYPLFRLLVWGTALICYMGAAKVLRLNITMSLFIMFLLYVAIFSYARASLAMSVYFLGFAIFARGRESKEIKLSLLGILILSCSYFFHNSFATIVLLTIFCVIPITKSNILPYMLIILILGVGIDIFIGLFQNILIDVGDSRLVQRLEHGMTSYDVRQNVNATIFGWIPIIWSYVPFYLTAFIVTRIVLNTRNVLPLTIQYLFRISFIIILLSIVLLLFSVQSYTYFYRYLYISFMPLSMLVVYLLMNGYMTKSKYRIIVYLCGGYNIWTFFTYLFK